MTSAAKPSLAAKIATVQKDADVESLARRHVTVETSTGGTYHYDYIEESTLARVIRPLLAGANVAVYYSDEITKLEGNLAAVKVSLTLVDGDSGERETMSTMGIGTDKGDKAVNKAKTAAMRYLLWKWFLAPSDNEPEAENVDRGLRADQIAPVEEIEAYLAEVEAAGFAVDPARAALDNDRTDGELAKTTLARHRRQFTDAVKAAKKDSEPEKPAAAGDEPDPGYGS